MKNVIILIGSSVKVTVCFEDEIGNLESMNAQAQTL